MWDWAQESVFYDVLQEALMIRQTQRPLGLPNDPTSILALLSSIPHTALREIFPAGKLDQIMSRFFIDPLFPKLPSGIYRLFRGMAFYGSLLMS